MKQTIKRSCFRLKQWAVSLFSMLCFGAAWGELVTTPMEDPSAGYIRTGAGEYGELTVVVFTNHTKEVSWTAPKDISNLQFLVVGGGGGGGGHCTYGKGSTGSDKYYWQGGAGGGGGAVVTGAIAKVFKDATFRIMVGEGGKGGVSVTSSKIGAEAGENGGYSSFSITNVTYITAYGGGGDGGYDSLGRGIGGSNSGMRGASDKNATPSDLISVNFIGEGANVLCATNMCNIGGKGYRSSSMSPGGGGGGACGSGRSIISGNPFENFLGDDPDTEDNERLGSGNGGDGGQGFVTAFIGVTATFGAGGGGGLGKETKSNGRVSYGGCVYEGSGAGDGWHDANGGNAAPNQGGGGGGGSYMKNGGAGGSGIVAFSYVTDEAARIAVDAAQVESMIADKVYTGGQLSSGLEDAGGYSVAEQDVDRINVGTYTVTVTLKDGYEWSDGNTDMTTNFTWQITQNPNSWTTAPYLSSEGGWTEFTASEMKCVVPEPEFGTISKTITSNGVTTEFNGTLPTALGVYTIAYSVEGTENYAALSWKRTFAIRRAVKIDDVGYEIYDLGEKSNEVAIVFTKSTDWTVPATLRNAQFLVVGGGGGGGAGSFDKNTDSTFHGIGGAGGGGGGVVTGLVNFVKGATMAITIGAGGDGGELATDNTLGGVDGSTEGAEDRRCGASDPGSPSSFGIGDTPWVMANGGGRDRGTYGPKSMNAGNIGGVGGSGGGNRAPNKTENAVTDQDGGSVNSSIINVLSYKPYAKPGGIHNPLHSSLYSSAGGGGATEKGFMAINNENPGNGGAGLYTDISGTTLCYGSGGGGGTTASSVESCGQGGPGAGNGNSVVDGSGYAGMDNRGGGGGGGYAAGGTGGSGVVVFRYAVYAAAIGDTLYATFKEAFNAAKDGETITLLDKVSISEMYTIGKNLTIDLCGCTISAEGDGDEFCVSPGVSLTVTDTNDNLDGNVGTVVDQYGNELVATGGVYTGPADTDYVAQIGDKKYLSLQAAVDAAQGGETITLLANVELTDDVTVNKSVTLAVGACTLTIPSGKTITIDADKSLAVTCGTGGLEVDGTIAVNGTLDVSGLSYGTSGLIANKAGNLAIGESGSVKLMSVWDSYSPNWLATNSSTFFAGSATGAQLVRASGTYTFNGTTWLVANAVAMTQITDKGYTFWEGFTTLAAAIAASVDGNVTLLANVALDTTFIVEKTLTLDMGGNTITAEFDYSATTPAAFWVKNGGDLTLTNGTLTATVEGVRLGVKQATDPATAGTATIASDAVITTSDIGVILYGGSTLTSSGTITSTSADYAAIQGNGLDTLESTITITGGSVSSKNNHAIYHPQPGTLTISGGTISGVTGIEMRAGTLDMSAGTVTATGTYATPAANNSGSTVNGAAIVLSQHSTGKNVTATITGGEITATENGKTFVVANTTGADPVSVTATIAAEVSFDASKAVVLIDTLKLDGNETDGYTLVAAAGKWDAVIADGVTGVTADNKANVETKLDALAKALGAAVDAEASTVADYFAKAYGTGVTVTADALLGANAETLAVSAEYDLPLMATLPEVTVAKATADGALAFEFTLAGVTIAGSADNAVKLVKYSATVNGTYAYDDDKMDVTVVDGKLKAVFKGSDTQGFAKVDFTVPNPGTIEEDVEEEE